MLRLAALSKTAAMSAPAPATSCAEGSFWMVRGFAALARSPVMLLATCLMLNALLLPYRGICHDAILYGAQVVNRADGGRLANDLFFKYGSQDRFSAFSRVAAPLVRAFGLEPAFLILYVVAVVVFLGGAVRLIRVMIPDPRVAAAGLILIAVTAIPFAGMATLYVNESFLTPRLLANGLVLFALERLIRGRFAQASGLLLVSLSLHPIMAVAGVAVAGLWITRRVLGNRGLAIVAVVAVGGISFILMHYPTGVRVLGALDPEWYEMVRQANPFNIPSEWAWADWLRIAVAFAVCGLAAYFHPNRATGELLVWVGLVALVGLLAASLTGVMPYALPLKVQPYRMVWLLQFLTIPLAVWLAARWWSEQTPIARMGAVGVLAVAVWPATDVVAVIVVILVSAPCLVFFRGLKRTPQRPDWLALGGIAALIGGAAVYALVIAARWIVHPEFLALLEPLEWAYVPSLIGQRLLVWLAALIMAAIIGWFWIIWPSRTMIGLMVMALATHAVFGLIPVTDWYVRIARPEVQDAQFIQTVVWRDTQQSMPSVYWPTPRGGGVWFGVRSDCYFEYAQISGNLFNRPNAVEVRRRARLVASFERFHYYCLRPRLDKRVRQVIRELFGGDPTDHPPDAADLARLCVDPAVDWVVLDDRFPRFLADDPITNGRVFIYDARKLRQRHADASTKRR